MWDELPDRIASLLTKSSLGVLCAMGRDKPSGAVVRYRSQGLDLTSLLPRWADVAFYIEERPQVLLLIALSEGCWLHYQGLAQVRAMPDWAELLPEGPPITSADRYMVVEITPRRIDLLDVSRAWGSRETLELL
jgi:hypothetical protein